MLKCAVSAGTESEKERLKNRVTQLAGLEIEGREVPKRQLYELFQISTPRDYEPSKLEEEPIKIDSSLAAIERYLEDREVFSTIWDLADYSQWWGKTNLFVTEDREATLVFDNHATKITWTVAKKWLRYGKPETFVSRLDVIGFLRESELPSFGMWLRNAIPELQGNAVHKADNNWSVVRVDKWGGSYHSAWHFYMSDNTTEYLRHQYIHATGSGKLSWSQIVDPWDFLQSLRLISSHQDHEVFSGVYDMRGVGPASDWTEPEVPAEDAPPAEEVPPEEEVVL